MVHYTSSLNFKINSRPLFTIIFKLKNGNFMTRDFSPLMKRVLAGVTTYTLQKSIQNYLLSRKVEPICKKENVLRSIDKFHWNLHKTLVHVLMPIVSIFCSWIMWKKNYMHWFDKIPIKVEKIITCKGVELVRKVQLFQLWKMCYLFQVLPHFINKFRRNSIQSLYSICA